MNSDDALEQFDRVTRYLPTLTPFGVMFDEAEEELLAMQPERLDPAEIGRLALEKLPEAEQKAALDELLSTYWEAREYDRDRLAWFESGGAR